MVLCQPFRYALSTSSTNTSFATQNATTTEPSGAGVIDLTSHDYGCGNRSYVPRCIQLIPFGTAAADKTFDMRLYGYVGTVANSALVSTSTIYIPQLLLDISVVVSAATLSGHAANTFLADAITVNKGAADNAEWRSVVSNANDSVANVIVHTRGVRYLKFEFDADAGAAASTNANCLWRPVDF